MLKWKSYFARDVISPCDHEALQSTSVPFIVRHDVQDCFFSLVGTALLGSIALSGGFGETALAKAARVMERVVGAAYAVHLILPAPSRTPPSVKIQFIEKETIVINDMRLLF